MTRVGTIIKKYRMKQGLSQEALAAALGGCSNVFISRIESGSAKLPISRVDEVCQALRISRHEINKAIADDLLNPVKDKK